VTGTVALAVKAFDRANGVNNRFGIYSATLEINGKQRFHVQYDRFDYSRTHLVELDKNFTLWRRGNGKFQNLFRHPLNNLDAYRQRIITGTKLPFPERWCGWNPGGFKPPSTRRTVTVYCLM